MNYIENKMYLKNLNKINTAKDFNEMEVHS